MFGIRRLVMRRLPRRRLGTFMVLVLTLGGSGFFMSYLSDVINGQRLREAMVVAATRHHTGPVRGAADIATTPRHGDSTCSDVITMMTQGRWIPRPLTKDERELMKKFRKQVAEGVHGLPAGSQRWDKRCGNLSFTGDTSPAGNRTSGGWFRALCDPDGPTPCCFNGTCVGHLRAGQCACRDCIDIRPLLHAEFATWRPWEPACGAISREMPWEEVCDLLSGATVYVVGDSIMRQFFTALLMIVRNDPVHGGLRKGASAGVKRQCSGIFMFPERVCRLWVDTNTTACPNRSATLLLGEVYKSSSGLWRNITATISSLANTPRSLLVLGVGLHDHLIADKTYREVVLPLLKRRSPGQVWPRIVWVNMHSPGVRKSPANNIQVPQTLGFNHRMSQLLGPLGVPVLDPYNMTLGVDSFDGTHFGYGVNSLKVRVLLHYVRDLWSKNQW